MPTIARHLEVLRHAQDLDHQVGADVARTDDGDLRSCSWCFSRCSWLGSVVAIPVARFIETDPRPAMCALTGRRAGRDHRAERAGEDDVAGAQRFAEVAGLCARARRAR